MTEYLFPHPNAQKGYRLFPSELEEDPNIFFHGTAAGNLQSIIDNGFKAGGTLESVSFSDTSDLALSYAISKRTSESPDGCVIAVHFETTDSLVCEGNVFLLYRLDKQPTIVGYCIIPADYRHV